MFLLFAYDTYYPEGASKDFVCQYKSFQECIDQILDTSTLKPKSRHTWNEIYDVMNDDWYIFQIIMEVKDGAEQFIEIEFMDPEGDEYIVDEKLIQDLLQIKDMVKRTGLKSSSQN
jgi:hypothetical protein